MIYSELTWRKWTRVRAEYPISYTPRFSGNDEVFYLDIGCWIFTIGYSSCPGLGAIGYFPETGDRVVLLRGFTGTLRLAMRLNPFATHSDRMFRRGVVKENKKNTLL
ncbi:hypothetical protein [Rhodohalobacter sp.]|uniref:hypothetical protein n=1 Tax=Rhodohalobacter sp. TaxID=1974210 RepID=UPI0035635EF6